MGAIHALGYPDIPCVEQGLENQVLAVDQHAYPKASGRSESELKPTLSLPYCYPASCPFLPSCGILAVCNRHPSSTGEADVVQGTR